MKKERILIAQDNKLLNDICSDLKDFKPKLEELKTRYELLEIGPFTAKVYGEIVYSGTAGIAKTFRASIESDIEKMGVSKTIIKDNIVAGSEALLDQFLTYVKELKSFKPVTYSRQKQLTLKYISFNEKGFVISVDNKHDILESECRIYLETEEEHLVYEDLTNFIKAFEVVEKYIINTGISVNQMSSILSYIEMHFLNRNGEKFEIKPNMIKWIVGRKSMI